jgi:hypothetical protein
MLGTQCNQTSREKNRPILSKYRPKWSLNNYGNRIKIRNFEGKKLPKSRAYLAELGAEKTPNLSNFAQSGHSVVPIVCQEQLNRIQRDDERKHFNRTTIVSNRPINWLIRIINPNKGNQSKSTLENARVHSLIFGFLSFRERRERTKWANVVSGMVENLYR